jgi:hypothetical protein
MNNITETFNIDNYNRCDSGNCPYCSYHGQSAGNIHKLEKHNKGIELAKEYQVLTLAYNGRWFADKPYRGESSVCSYECLGLHAHTEHLVAGAIEAGMTVNSNVPEHN